jgi:hypothetical protein
VKQSHTSWKLGTHSPATNPAHAPKGGTRFSFDRNEAATVTMAFTEKDKHGKDVAKGTVTIHATAGTTHEYIAGKLGHGDKLTVGKAKVTITATNENGISSKKALSFTVAKPH